MQNDQSDETAKAVGHEHQGSETAEVEALKSCPSCTRFVQSGEMIYECEVCGDECCTVCSDTTVKHDVICHGCVCDGPTEETDESQNITEEDRP